MDDTPQNDSIMQELPAEDIANHGSVVTFQDDEAEKTANRVLDFPVIFVESPSVHPMYAAYSKRLESYPNPFYHVHSKEDLARSGFFYVGSSDCVRCFQCGLSLRKWFPGNVILKEHENTRPDCPFLQLLLRASGVNTKPLDRQSGPDTESRPQAPACVIRPPNVRKAQQNAGDAQQNAEDAQQNAGDAQQNAGDAQQNAGDAQQNAGDAQQNAGKAQQNAGDAQQNAGKAQQSAGDAQQKTKRLMATVSPTPRITPFDNRSLMRWRVRGVAPVYKKYRGELDDSCEKKAQNHNRFYRGNSLVFADPSPPSIYIDLWSQLIRCYIKLTVRVYSTELKLRERSVFYGGGLVNRHGFIITRAHHIYYPPQYQVDHVVIQRTSRAWSDKPITVVGSTWNTNISHLQALFLAPSAWLIRRAKRVYSRIDEINRKLEEIHDSNLFDVGKIVALISYPHGCATPYVSFGKQVSTKEEAYNTYASCMGSGGSPVLELTSNGGRAYACHMGWWGSDGHGYVISLAPFA